MSKKYKFIADEDSEIKTEILIGNKKIPLVDTYCTRCGCLQSHEKYEVSVRCINCGKITEL